MQRLYAIARLVVCYLLTIFFFCYFFKGSANIIYKNNTTFTDIISNESEKSEEIKVEKAESQEKKTQNTSSKQPEETAQVSAKAVKGKIVTKYISPYNASSSYDSVYLKNSCEKSINIKNLLNQKSTFKIEKSTEPQVLIMHTHTTESYMQQQADYYTEEDKPRSTDNGKNMVKIGKIITEKLNKSGIKTLHDKTKHDYPEYTGSYGRSAQTVSAYLKKYPSIKVVIDLHRDSVTQDGKKAKLVTKIKGKNAAQVMLVMGSNSSTNEYPNWEKNLSLAVKFQQKLELNYPTLARPLLLRTAKYNQNLTTGSMLLEVGTEANTMAEAEYSAELVANALIKTLETLK
ncbi:MAG: stage II sporulation protein P [Ruminococcaceae bacterium]|nr:stage II sporulation protein P [Oscillospiraceae bacterium]